MKITLYFFGILFLMFSCKQKEIDPIKKEALYSFSVEQKIKDLSIELHYPELPPGVSIKRAVRSGNYIYLSGNGPIDKTGKRTIGKVGTDLSIEEGYNAARQTAINHISILKNEIGDLNNVVQVVKVLGMVNCNSDFTDHPKVINGYSELMIEVFGERGKHARSAVGMNSLPWGLACEVEAIVEVR